MPAEDYDLPRQVPAEDCGGYLRWLFTHLPGLPEQRLEEVTPLAWAAENGLESKLLVS